MPNDERTMPGEQTETGRVARNFRTTWLIVAAVGFLLAWRLADVILLLFGSVVVATAMRALAAPLRRYLHLPPRPALAAAVIIALLALALPGWLIGDRVVAQTEILRQQLPEALAAFQRWLMSHSLGQVALSAWESAQTGDIPWGQVAGVAGRTLGAVGAAALVVIVGIYLAADPELYRRGTIRLLPVTYRTRVDDALTASGHALSRWLLGQGISMLFVGSATAVGLALLGMPMALALGLIAGLLAFIPFFGAIAAGLLAILLAFSQGPEMALYVTALVIVIQQVEGHLLIPLVQRWAVALPPVLTIIASVVFGLLFGVVGIMFATPLMVVVMVLVQRLYVEAILESSAMPARDRERPS